MSKLMKILNPAIAILTALLITFPCLAQNIKPKRVRKPISAPVNLAPSKVVKPIGCTRKAKLGDELIPCDSYHRKDAEQLRPLISDIPAALSALDDYQSARDRAKIGTYTGSLGLLIALTGWIVSTQISEVSTANQIRSYTTAGGLGLTLGSVIFSLATLSAAESHLDRAVSEYNKVHPKKPLSVIEIKTRILF